MKNKKPKPKKAKSLIDNKSLSLSDDAAMRVALPNNVEAAKAILSPILGRSDFEVIRVSVEQEIKFLQKHGVSLDCVIEFADGTLCDLEMQKAKSGMPIERLLYYAAMLRVNALGEGIPYRNARTNIIIVVYNGDYFGEKQPLYEIFYRIQSGKAVDWKQFIYIADATNRDKSTPLGRLMSDLTAIDPKSIEDSELKKALSMVQSKKGGKAVNEELLKMNDKAREEGVQEGREQGLQEGREQGLQQGQRSAILSLVRDGSITLEKAASVLGISEKEVKALLDA